MNTARNFLSTLGLLSLAACGVTSATTSVTYAAPGTYEIAFSRPTSNNCGITVAPASDAVMNLVMSSGRIETTDGYPVTITPDGQASYTIKSSSQASGVSYEFAIQYILEADGTGTMTTIIDSQVTGAATWDSCQIVMPLTINEVSR